MKHTDNILTGGDGVTGQYGLEVRTRINNQFAVVMGNTEYLPETFVFTTLNLLPFANKVIEIAFQHDLAGASFTLPNNCTLYFNGGALLNAGTITGSNTRITNPNDFHIFSTTTIFAGTWISVEAAPQWFGAVCSPSRTVPAGTAINSSPAIQAVFDSPFGYKPIKGFYYIPTEIKITKPCYVDFGGMLTTSYKDHGSVYNPEPKYVCFYTDQNNSFFKIQTHSTSLLNATLDITQSPGYTSKMVVYDMNYCMWGAWLKLNLVDNRPNCRLGGAIGVGIINKDLQRLDPTTVAGFLTDLHADLNCNWIAKPFWIEDASAITYSVVNPPLSACWINGINIKAKISGYKEIYLGNFGYDSYHDIYMQTGHTLTIEERDTLYSGYIGTSSLRLYMMDLMVASIGTPPNEYWYNTLGVKLGKNVILSQDSQYGSGIIGSPRSVKGVDNISNVVLLAQKSNRSYFISELHNLFIGYDKRGTFTMLCHNGANTDFDNPTPTVSSEPITSNIIIDRPETILRHYAYATTIKYLADSDNDKDFVELAFLGSIANGNIHLAFDGNAPKRIQVIEFKSSGNPVITTVDVVAKDGYNANVMVKIPVTTSSTSLAIRIIGCHTTNGTIYINDIAFERTTLTEGLNLVSKIDDYCYKWAGLLTQTGTSTPTFNEILNTTRQTVTTEYLGVGNYKLICTNRLTVNKTDPVSETAHVYNGTTFVGTVKISRTNSNEFLIQTWDSSGVLANDILSNQHVSFNVGW